jgi:hypothetical protein
MGPMKILHDRTNAIQKHDASWHGNGVCARKVIAEHYELNVTSSFLGLSITSTLPPFIVMAHITSFSQRWDAVLQEQKISQQDKPDTSKQI